jgi:hypothetical protein
MRVLRLVDVQVVRERVLVDAALDDLEFHFSIWTEDVDLRAVAARHGEAYLSKLALHIALFQMNAMASLRPDVIELGRFARFATPELVTLWSQVFRGVFAQWRYEHDLPDYAGPRFVDVPASAEASDAPGPIDVAPGPVELLAFSGGGKDSLVALELLRRAGLSFATLGYSHSIYGPADAQHALLERLASASARRRAERQWVYDDFIDSPVAKLRPSLGVRSLLAAETPASVFAAVPLAILRGYRGLVVAHERSANAANLVWRATGEAVNHQWGKGWEAERLLDAYLGRELVVGLRYFSVLQPVHDEVIFELLAESAALAPLTHSCNLAKPWCRRCAKCVYVWLQMAAHLPREVVDATFGGEDLGAVPANAHHLRELLGLAAHPPFDCVGSVPEARLALTLALRQGHESLRRFGHEESDVAALAAPFVGVDESAHGMPAHVAAGIRPQLRRAAAAARQRLGISAPRR